MGKNWYVIHTYSGFEGKVKGSLEEKIHSSGLTEKFGKIMIPTEEVVEIKEGKKKISNKKFFPGYVLIEMEMGDETWQLVKGVPKVTGFVGGGDKPVPLSPEEVQTLQIQIDTGTAQPRSKVQFQKGENVRIIDGPFLGFNGSVEEVHQEQSRLKVFVSIFGRPTPVELGFLQVEKI
jgi:transcriptional antiterminator NusG